MTSRSSAYFTALSIAMVAGGLISLHIFRNLSAASASDAPAGGPVGQASRLPSSNLARSLLLTGDIQDQAIATLRAAHPNLRADIMEVPHHGSAHQAAIDWLAEINPPIALQSTGPQRANDPRWQSTRTPRTWYCTCLNGAAWSEIASDGSLRSGTFLSP